MLQQRNELLGNLHMKTLFITLAAMALTTPAIAAEAPAVTRNQAIFSAEGTKLGKVERVIAATDGSPVAVRLIYRGKFITVPLQTLSTGEKGLTTTMTNAELKKL
jgi:hypothetical protein